MLFYALPDHNSDLFVQYLPVQDKPCRLMQEWLPEFFFKTEDGTRRSPANEEEREQKNTVRTSGTLRGSNVLPML